MGKYSFFIVLSSVILAFLLLTACGPEAAPVVVGQTAVPSPGATSPAAEPTVTLVDMDPEETAVTPTPPVTNTPEPIATDTAVPDAPPITPTEDIPDPGLTLTETIVSLPVSTDTIIVNHASIPLFEQIPEEYLQAAAALNMAFIDRSVGFNIHQGLDCLTHETNATAPNYCKRWQHLPNYPEFSVDPGEVNWYHPGGHDRSNWDYFTWPGAGDPAMQMSCAASTGEWFGVAECFEQWATGALNNYQVLSFQFGYLEVDHNVSIADQPGGFFWDNDNRYDVYDLQAFTAQHPDHVFIYWTTSLARGIGSSVSESFNEQMRQYAIANDLPLFDVADILSHAPDGTPCYDNRDGISYDNGNQFENYPDDGLDVPAICPHYTTETDGGHLGSVSAGMIRAAKGFWVLMAQIAGWQP
ncbi:MAG: hypothetical protein IAE79_10775 [Anaerolinea sp.]|nr:hypothetical protein [Anaerolinea sp.]